MKREGGGGEWRQGPSAVGQKVIHYPLCDDRHQPASQSASSHRQLYTAYRRRRPTKRYILNSKTKLCNLETTNRIARSSLIKRGIDSNK